MALAKKLTNYLEKNKIKFKAIEHRTVYTAWDLAKTMHISKMSTITKTLIVKADREYLIVLLPANRNLDKNKFKKLVNQQRKKEGSKAIKKISFVKENWLKKTIKVGKIGAIPPFAGLLKLPLFIDRGILKNKKIFVNSGDYRIALEISSKALVKLEQPVQGGFSKKK